ncbi:hypothetical protein DOE73_25970 [Paenibacillus dendritiformis]|nr:hypothetical protein DOE73_25970 [Paenibacillus dendritiformis]
MTYRKIDQNTEEGFQDLAFDIVEFRFEEERSHFLVLGQFHHEIVGFEVSSEMICSPESFKGRLMEKLFIEPEVR